MGIPGKMDKIKKSKTLTWVLLAVLVVVGGAAYWFVVKPRTDLGELAKDTCAEMDGAIVLQIGPILKKAQSRAERLGFTAPDLGDCMREECPGTMEALDQWVRQRKE